MPRPTAAQLAARLKGSNSTMIVSADPQNDANDFYGSDRGPEGIQYEPAGTASTADAIHYHVAPTADVQEMVVPVGDGMFATAVLDKNTVRTHYFIVDGTYDSTKEGFGAKRCFVNDKGQPLDANGLPTTVDAAVDAESGTLSIAALGEDIVTSYAQVYKNDGTATPLPGKYSGNRRQTSLYAPYVGWTCQHDAS